MYSDLGPPAGLSASGLGAKVHRFGAPGVGLQRFLDGISGAEAGGRKDDSGFQTRGTSDSNLVPWRLGLVSDSGGGRTKSCKLEARVASSISP